MKGKEEGEGKRWRAPPAPCGLPSRHLRSVINKVTCEFRAGVPRQTFASTLIRIPCSSTLQRSSASSPLACTPFCAPSSIKDNLPYAEHLKPVCQKQRVDVPLILSSIGGGMGVGVKVSLEVEARGLGVVVDFSPMQRARRRSSFS